MNTLGGQMMKAHLAQQHNAGPITTAADLPQVGDRESQTLDFKVKLSRMKASKKPKLTELAKDLAALANARGGNLLVGATEVNEALSAYVPLTDSEAKEAIAEYEKAASQFCSPKPVVVCSQIAEGAGFVVSVFVHPHPGNLMGVKIPVAAADEYSGGDAYRFPVRVASQTVYVEPSAFPVPEARRLMLSIARINPLEKIQLIYRTNHPGGLHHPVHEFISLDIPNQEFSSRVGTDPIRRTPIDHVRFVVPPAQGVSSYWKIQMKEEARW